jgi:hypothetical protein
VGSHHPQSIQRLRNDVVQLGDVCPAYSLHGLCVHSPRPARRTPPGCHCQNRGEVEVPPTEGALYPSHIAQPLLESRETRRADHIAHSRLLWKRPHSRNPLGSSSV